jgi:hypothetical protein
MPSATFASLSRGKNIVKSSLWIVAALVICCAVGGCGPQRPKRVPVSGTVIIDGKPLTRGTVSFVPQDARPATGEIGPDGRFTLSTFGEGDGCVPGSHTVTVFANEWLTPTQLKWHAPKEYADIETSTLKVEITGPRDDLQIELTWDGQQPVIELQESE